VKKTPIIKQDNITLHLHIISPLNNASYKNNLNKINLIITLVLDQ